MLGDELCEAVPHLKVGHAVAVDLHRPVRGVRGEPATGLVAGVEQVRGVLVEVAESLQVEVGDVPGVHPQVVVERRGDAAGTAAGQVALEGDDDALPVIAARVGVFALPLEFFDPLALARVRSGAHRVPFRPLRAWPGLDSA